MFNESLLCRQITELFQHKLWYKLNSLHTHSGFALTIAIVAKCEEKLFLAQKNIIWRKQVAKKNLPIKKYCHQNITDQ